MKDLAVEQLIQKELEREAKTINLIPSENYVSKDVLSALGSVFTNKYAEGYPGKRYYGGNEVVDEIENLAKDRALKLFNLDGSEWSVNVQPYSGSPANLAVYTALAEPGQKIMGMRLDMGGHLTHGHKVSATGKFWRQIPYTVEENSEMLNYGSLMELALREAPKIIVAGYTAYPRLIDFREFRKIASAAGAILMADISHIAGLIAAGFHPSPFPYADIVTTTIHKTLRGPRSAVIFSKKEYSEKIDRAVFPGLQGGPHINQIAAIAVAFEEARRPEFKSYAEQIIKNAKCLSLELKKLGWRLVSGGTDNHLLLVDTWGKAVSGKEASDSLEDAGIIVNKNTIPYDKKSPVDPSGIRLGAPAITTRGMKEKEVCLIAEWIDAILKKTSEAGMVKSKVFELCKNFPLPY